MSNFNWLIEQCLLTNDNLNNKRRKSFLLFKCVEDNKIFYYINTAASFYNVSSSAVSISIKTNKKIIKINKTFTICFKN